MPVFMHTRVRVSDLDRSSAFYCDHLGFKTLAAEVGHFLRPLVHKQDDNVALGIIDADGVGDLL